MANFRFYENKKPENEDFELGEDKNWLGIYASNNFEMFDEDCSGPGDNIIDGIRSKLKEQDSKDNITFVYSYNHKPQFDMTINDNGSHMIARYELDYSTLDEDGLGCDYKRIELDTNENQEKQKEESSLKDRLANKVNMMAESINNDEKSVEDTLVK